MQIYVYICVCSDFVQNEETIKTTFKWNKQIIHFRKSCARPVEVDRPNNHDKKIPM